MYLSSLFEQGQQFSVSRFITFGVVSAILAGCSGGDIPTKQSTYDESHYRKLERDVFNETNRLRTNPAAYNVVLKDILERMDGKVYRPENSDIGILTQEGAKAVKEAISVLDRQKRLSRLQWSEELAELARAHVADTGARGITGHSSSNGKDFSQRVSAVIKSEKFTFSAENLSYGYDTGHGVVSQLIIDDGVPSRGHRKNLLVEQLSHTGVGCGYHRQYGHMCAAIYAYRK